MAKNTGFSKNTTPEEIRELYIDKNMSQEEIGKRYGVSGVIVSRFLKKYGIKKSRDMITENMWKTTEERYGRRSSFGEEEVRKKIKETLRKKYGVDNPAHNPDSVKKREQTNYEKTGYTNPFLNPEVQKRIKEQHEEKYGGPAASCQEVKDKTKKTNAERYEGGHPLRDPAIVEKRRRNEEAKYGLPGHQYKGWTKESYEIYISKEKMEDFIRNSDDKTVKGLSEKLGISYSVLDKRLRKFGLYHLIDSFSSFQEKQIKDFLKEHGIKAQKDKIVLHPFEIDAYAEELSFGIEFNGIYWHRADRDEIGEDYHFRKSMMAQEKGIFIYQVYEFEWENESSRKYIENDILSFAGRLKKIKKFTLTNFIRKEYEYLLEINHCPRFDGEANKYIGVLNKNKTVGGAAIDVADNKIKVENIFVTEGFDKVCVIAGVLKKVRELYPNMIIEVESSIDTEIDTPYKTAGFKFANFIPSNNILCCLMPFYFYIEESKLTKEEIFSLRERHRIITIRKAGKKLWRFIPNGESAKPVSNL